MRTHFLELVLGFAVASCGGKLASVDAPDGGADASSIDASPAPSDAKPPNDVQAPPPTDALAPPACAPAPVGTSTNDWKPPKRQPNACQGSDIADFAVSCFSSTSAPQKCSAFTQAHPGCASCLSSELTDAQRGPLVDEEGGALVYLNQAGCVALVTNDASPTSCAVSVDALRACTKASCAACPLSDSTDFMNMLACRTAAESSTCSAYAGPATCLEKVAPQCGPATDFVALLTKVAPLFCGP